MLKTYLDVKSGYSFFQSTLKIDDIIDNAKTFNIKALCLSDINGMYRVMEFYQKCKKANLKPIIGMEFNVKDEADGVDSFLLVAKNNEGYKNLSMITDFVSFSGKDIKISYDDFLLYKEGLIVIMPVLRSSLFQLILNKNDD